MPRSTVTSSIALKALPGFFGVPPAYFFDDAAAERIDAELALPSALRDAGLITSNRHGQHTLHAVTSLGTALLDNQGSLHR
ncbi:hypothetical protein [Streptomyces boncukensis]|uniref:hypothetical protein n=1 Tax=Streptomyces boncukensis TaxID=2711219 RepID=UPI0019D10089|nr:hypothetical protein [Streptomyces boncukensis]